MPRKPDKPAGKEPVDSRLSEFLRRAGPVLAAERGWNPQSRLKLKSLADDLKLPPALFESAIQQLEGRDGSTPELTRYEQEFVRKLKKQLQPQSGQVLTAVHEQRAIESAGRKYRIPPPRARDLVRQVASDLGLSRVSRLDAVAHVGALVDETIGGSVNVNPAMRDRVLAAAAIWGVDRDQVEILIDNRLAANIQSARPRRAARTYVLAALAGIAVFALLVWFFLSQFEFPRSSPEPVGESADSTDVTTETASPWPSVWSETTRNRWTELAADDHQLSLPRQRWLNPDPGQRAQGIPAVVDLALGTVQPARDQASQFLISLVADNDPVSDELFRHLAERLEGPDPNRVPTSHACESVFAAADLLHQCHAAAPETGGRNAIDRILQYATGVIRTNSARYAEDINFALARNMWQHIYAASSVQPQSVARVFTALLQLTRQRSGSQAVRLAWPTAVRVFSSEGDAWQFMREPLAALVDQASQDQLFQIFDVTFSQNDRDKSAWLLPRVGARVQISSEGQSLDQLAAAISKRFGLSGSGWEPAVARWSLLQELPDYRTLLEPQTAASPQAIADTAHLATAAWLLWRAEAGANPGLLDSFDRLVAAGPRRLSARRLPDRRRQTLPEYGRVQRRSLPSDIQTRRSSLERLQRPQEHSPAARAAAFERLATVANRFADVTDSQATSIARFMLTATETPEVVAIEQHGPRMNHWLNLALAASEQVLESDVAMDQAITVARVLTGLEFESPQANAWRRELNRDLRHRIADGLRHTAELQGDDGDYLWDELRSYLVELYRLRCQAADIPASLSSAATSPAELERLLIKQLAPADPRLLTTEFLANDSLDDAILAGQLLVMVVGDDAPVPLPAGQPDTDPALQAARQMLANEQELLRRLVTEGGRP